MQLTLPGLSQIEYLVNGQVLFSYYRSIIGLDDGESSFDAFLQEESILVEVTEVAIERIVVWLGAIQLKVSALGY
jgi:hypothetical protein